MLTATPILNAVALAAGVVTDGNVTEVDMSNKRLTREFIFSAKIVENGTAPGASRTVTVNFYWSDERVALADVATVLAGRKTAATAVTRTNSASVTRHFTIVTSPSPIRPLAKYLYVTITKTTEDADSIPTLTLWMVAVPPQNPNPPL